MGTLKRVHLDTTSKDCNCGDVPWKSHFHNAMGDSLLGGSSRCLFLLVKRGQSLVSVIFGMQVMSQVLLSMCVVCFYCASGRDHNLDCLVK